MTSAEGAVLAASIAAICSLIGIAINLGLSAPVRRRVLALEDASKKAEAVRVKALTTSEETLTAIYEYLVQLREIEWEIQTSGPLNPEDFVKRLGSKLGEARNKARQQMSISSLYCPEQYQDLIPRFLAESEQINFDLDRLKAQIEAIANIGSDLTRVIRAAYVDA